MSLSGEARQTLTSLQIAGDIALALKTLMANPDLAKLAKDAYGLSEAEEARSKQAREDIARYQKQVADAEATMVQLDEYQQQLDGQAASNKKEKSRLDDVAKALDKKKSDLMTQELTLRDREKALERREQGVSDGEARLARDNDALNKEKERVNKYEAELKARGEQLRALTGGL